MSLGLPMPSPRRASSPAARSSSSGLTDPDADLEEGLRAPSVGATSLPTSTLGAAQKPPVSPAASPAGLQSVGQNGEGGPRDVETAWTGAPGGGMCSSVLLLRVMYCTIFGAFGVYEPFLSVFLATVKGFALPQVGFLVAIPPLVGFMSSTTWTTFADAHSSHLTCLFGAGIASIFCMILLWLSSSFIQTALMLALFSFFRAPLTPLLDTTSMRVLRSDTKSYGRLRMFGGLGFGLFAFVVGNLVDWFDFRLMIFCYIFCMSIFVYLVSVLGKIDKSLYKSDSKLQERRIGKRPSILSLLQRRDVLLFVVTEFFLGISHHTITNFLFLYLAGTLGATKTLMGVMIAMSIMSEVPVFYFSPQLISRLGYDKMIIIAHGAVIIRLLAYTLIGTATLALGIQLLHGLTFACMWAAAVVHANALAPPGQEATLQGLLTASFTGLGSATGSILGGIIFQNLGPILLYRMAAAVVVLSLGLFVWGRRKN